MKFEGRDGYASEGSHSGHSVGLCSEGWQARGCAGLPQERALVPEGCVVRGSWRGRLAESEGYKTMRWPLSL